MDIDEGTRDLHPDELLAGYVDGSGHPEEREAVERHLATCERCRKETALAASARAVLASLPELEAPGLSNAGLEAFRRERAEAFSAPSHERELTPDRTRSRLSRIHWDRIALGAGLAAAAGLFVVFVAIGLTRSPQGETPSAARGGAGPSGLPAVVDRGATYSPATLQHLSTLLRAPAKAGKRLSQPPDGALFEGASPGSGQLASSEPSPVAQPAGPASVLACLRSGTGLLPFAQPIYLEAASFQGTPAYIGAFVLPPAASGSPSHLLVVAVSASGCQPLYEVRQSI